MKINLAISLIMAITSSALAILPEESVIIQGKGTKGPYSLGFRHIIKNSLRIVEKEAELPAEEFEIDYAEGIIMFDLPIPLGDTLVAIFRYLPLGLYPRYYLHEFSPEEKSGRMERSPVAPVSDYSRSDITVRGSKGFSIQTGQGGGGLSQSLNLTINGQLVPGLMTSAHISDNSAGGNAVSRRIDELDRIFVKAESDHFVGTFGDFDYSERSDRFLKLEKKLTGLSAAYTARSAGIRGAAGFFPGEYKSITINGIDGRLGPYYLTDNGGRQGAVIIPGSEKVYLDGVPQTRGSQNDYTVEYGSGAIQFSPPKIIRDETRITIEYELSRDEYSRAFYASSGNFKPADGLTIFGSVIQEGDNKNSPKTYELTPQVEGILESAGGNRLDAARQGAEYVGPTLGDYRVLIDTLGNSIYQYAGPEQGDYLVSFSFIAANAGSYRTLGAGVFEYVGPGNGGYEPIILIPLPEMKRYASTGTRWISGDSSVVFKTEIAGSAYDKNTASGKDNVKSGASGMAELDLVGPGPGSDGFIGLNLKTRSIGSDAIFPGRIDEIERYRDYDLIPDSDPGGERLLEVDLTGGLNETRKVYAGFGYLSRPDLKRRLTQKGGTYWNIRGPLAIFADIRKTLGDRSWLKNSGGISLSLKNTQPVISADFEKRDGLSGFKYIEYKTSVPAAYTATITGHTELSLRNEKYLDGSWRDKFSSGQVQQKLVFSSNKTGFAAETAASYFRKKYHEYPGTDSRQRSGWGRLAYNDQSGRGNFSIYEKLGSSNERLQAKNYIFVGGGNGEFRYEDGEYIRDPDGDYIMVIEELGEGLKITEIGTELSGSVSPFLLVSDGQNLESSMGRLVAETELTYLLRKSSDMLVGRDFLPIKSAGLDDVVFRNGRIDWRLYYYPPFKKQRIRYAGSLSFQEGRPYANETTTEDFISHEISWAFPLGNSLDMALSGLSSKRDHQSNGLGYFVAREKGAASADLRFFEYWTFRLGSSFEVARQTDSGVKSSIPSAEIGVIRDLQDKGRISGGVTYYRVNVNPAGTYLPYHVAQGKNEGDNFEANIRAKMALTENGRLEISYRYEDFTKRPKKQSLRIEFTVLFL